MSEELANMRVTAVLPAYNEAGRVGATVRSVASQVDEVLIIDDDSTDATAADAEAAEASVSRQSKTRYRRQPWEVDT